MAKVYVGLRQEGKPPLILARIGNAECPLPDRVELWRYDPPIMDWGWSIAGSCQLGLALLADATGCTGLALKYAGAFAGNVLCHLPRRNFRLTRDEVLMWLLDAIEREVCPPLRFQLTGGSNGSQPSPA